LNARDRKRNQSGGKQDRRQDSIPHVEGASYWSEMEVGTESFYAETAIKSIARVAGLFGSYSHSHRGFRDCVKTRPYAEGVETMLPRGNALGEQTTVTSWLQRSQMFIDPSDKIGTRAPAERNVFCDGTGYRIEFRSYGARKDPLASSVL
jgi:hypothetical protein